MRHGALFNGIGGFQLAAHWMDWQNVFHCEIDKFCNQVVKRYFPESICYEDIKKTDFSSWAGKIDILTGGFPCQPYSLAGKRKGDADDRHLWPEMLRAIGEIRPRWVVGENVPGLINWGYGVVFEQIQTDLEAKGYEVFPPVILPACGKEAPHERARVWIVAHANGRGFGQYNFPGENRCASAAIEGSEQREERNDQVGERVRGIAWRNAQEGSFTFPLLNNGEEIQIEERISVIGQEYFSECAERRNFGWDSWPTQHPVCSGNDGLSSELDGITFSKWRQESIKAAGNAIVPQIALEIFRAIEHLDKQFKP